MPRGGGQRQPKAPQLPRADAGAGTQRDVPMLEVHKLDAERFWAEHIAPRKPALIRGHPPDMAWRASALWTDDYLAKQAGGAQVMVEVRAGPGDSYGKGVRRCMAFGDFVRQHVAAGDANLYLTAQQRPVAPDGHPALLAEPLLSLAADLPAAPALMGQLVPQSLNCWLGAAPEGSSSGLHHDFHDNLYVLLRGAKRFRLYPPHAAPRMYTSGRLAALHPNGRIVYEGQGHVLADGSDAAEAARWQRRTAAEAAVEAAEAAVAAGKKGAQRRLARAEAALEALLDDELAGGAGGGGGGDDSDDSDGEGGWGGRDDFDDDPELAGLAAGNNGRGRGSDEDEEEDEDEDEDGDASDEDGADAPGAAQEQQKGTRGGAAKAHNGVDKHVGSGGGGGGGGAEGDVEVDAHTPPSFSAVPVGDPAVSDGAIAAAFPAFPGRGAAIEVVVEAGMMLYLPAGWFHEVTSYGGGTGPGSGHFAVNYWFHPPDRLDPGRAGFRAPYKSDYWPSLWRARVAAGLPGGMDQGPGAQAPPRAGGAAAGDAAEADGEEEEEEEEEGGLAGKQASGDKRRRPSPAAAATAGGGVGVDVDADGDQDPPRRRRRASTHANGGAAAAAADGDAPQVGSAEGLAAAVAAFKQAQQQAQLRGGDATEETREGSTGAGGEQQMDEAAYQLVLQASAAMQRRAAMSAFAAFFEKREKLRRYRRMLARLPQGRRHHPVVRVDPNVRNWRPRRRLARAGGSGGGAAGGKPGASEGVHKAR